MTSAVRFNRIIEHKDVCRRGTLISHIGFDGWRGWVVSDHLYMSGKIYLIKLRAFFPADKSILLTLMEKLYFTLLLIRQKMYDRDWIELLYNI